MKRSTQKLVHFIASCEVCDWETADYINGRSAAKNHAQRTGHEVTAETGYVMVYHYPKVSQQQGDSHAH